MFEWLGWFGVPWLRNLLSHGCTSAQHLDGSGTLKPASSRTTEREMTRKRKTDVINKRQALWMSINAHLILSAEKYITDFICIWSDKQNNSDTRNMRTGDPCGPSQCFTHGVLWYLGTSGCCDQLQNILVNWGWVKTLVPSEHQDSWDLWMWITH